MFGLFRKKTPPEIVPIVRELERVRSMIASLNISVVADDFDAGFDTAIDEVLNIIDGCIKSNIDPTLHVNSTTETDHDYSSAS